MSRLFSVSERVHAGSILLAELAADPERRQSLQEIGQRMQLSQGYLEEIAASLRRHGLVEAKRGGAGGYRLARPAETVSLHEVVTAIEGPIALVACQAHGEAACPVSARCRTRSVWGNVQNRLLETLREISLQELVV